MKASITKSFKVNMGNFESEEISATITVSTEDLYVDPDALVLDPDEHANELKDFASKHVDAFLKIELDEAAEMSQAEKSILPKPQSTRPRRTEKVQRRSTS